MDTTAETPQGVTSPPVEQPSVPQSRTLSKTTVTSANLVSVGETNLATSAGSISTVDRHPPLNNSTPRRRPSFLEQQPSSQQLPTPRGSLQWPSTHRSFSSAAATRDSSRHSQATDRATTTTGLNISASASRHGRAPSSTCHTPISSHDDHSDHRSSAFSASRGGGGGGGGNTRRTHSSGPTHAAPPLVDVRDSPSQGPQSASHSVYTTGLCTPRETTAASTTGHGRHPSPFPGQANISATLSVGSRGAVTPAPPMDDFEAEAQALTRDELEGRVEQMRSDNVVLRTSVLRLRESLATLQEGMRANYADIERRQDNIANLLLRRLEATKRHRGKLVAHLRAVELEKASQEAKLHTTKQSIKELSKHLKREEQEIANRLQGRLEKLHAQREQLDKVLVEQSNSLQQLEQLVQEVEEMDLGVSEEVAEGSVSQNAPTSASVLNTAEAAATTSAETSVPLAVANASSSLLPTAAAAAAAAPLSFSQVGASLSAPNFHERSSSRASIASSTAGTATTTTADVAYDPTAMIRYLEEEIAAAESLRSEALTRADQYVTTRERLERRLKREKEHRAEQESRTAALRQELRSASTAANERVAAQETAMEMEVDRHLNSSRLGGDIVSSASSACATPKLRAVSSAVVSRGNSVSPYSGQLPTTAQTLPPSTAAGMGSGGPSTGGGGGGGAASDSETRPPPVEAFLLPSSSSLASVPPAVSISHADPHNAGHAAGATTTLPASGAGGDGQSALQRLSSSSMRINTSINHDETTASSESTPHATRLLVQDTSRMAAPRPVTSAESTPKRTPLATPQMSMSHEPSA